MFRFFPFVCFCAFARTNAEGASRLGGVVQLADDVERLERVQLGVGHRDAHVVGHARYAPLDARRVVLEKVSPHVNVPLRATVRACVGQQKSAEAGGQGCREAEQPAQHASADARARRCSAAAAAETTAASTATAATTARSLARTHTHTHVATYTSTFSPAGIRTARIRGPAAHTTCVDIRMAFSVTLTVCHAHKYGARQRVGSVPRTR